MTAALLLRLYPASWRARYADELEALILEAHGGHVPWRVRADVVRAAARERLRAAGLAGDGRPGERMRGGALLVLCAWAPFVAAGIAVQKFSEHWQAVTPTGSRALPRGAFDALLAGAAAGSVLVVAGVALTLPQLARFARSGAWRQIRARLLVASALTAAAVPVSVAVVVWAHRLSAADRAGRDAAYATVTILWAVLLAGCLAAWTVAGVSVARRLDLARSVLRIEAALAGGVALSMAATTTATAVWWAALARSAPWFLAGEPVGAPSSALAPALLGAGALMLLATAAAAVGARHALLAAGEPTA